VHPVLSSDRPRGQVSARGGIAPIVANTNLEQISDWLTKILVGVGLTQFAPIARDAGRLFASLAPSFGGGNVGTAFAGGLVLYMVTSGFATGWLFTRLFLGRAMVAADPAAALIDRAKQEEEAGNPDTGRTLRSLAQEVLETTDAAAVLSTESAPSPVHRALVYEDDVMSAFRRLNLSVERTDGPRDATVAIPDDPARQVNVVVRYRSQGPFTMGDLRRVREQFAFQPISGGVLVVTNTPLTKEVELQNSGTTGDPRRFVVVTWNDERDDQRLLEAFMRAAG
jgi:hypothetical protein